ncbi:hypothetical protein JK358_22230 [Nocardia sp. 2]|uniref:Lipoprotein n=1 Tax=Nocardia acididurans TaxID=2802282 RepID=A0ABS1M900_9NOCA|nr:hypothetical protein [Nocardia acididurans]MBL1077120.1 hypothetical protein [Nocardia acididurans]
MNRALMPVVAVALIGTLAGCGSSATTESASPSATSSVVTTTADRTTGLGVASKTTCGVFMTKGQSDKESLLAQVVAENPKWEEGRRMGSMLVSWAEMNCTGDGKADQAIGVALSVDPSTAVDVSQVSTMTCATFRTVDTDDDTGIALMQQLIAEQPQVDKAGPFITLLSMRRACEAPDAANRTLVSLAE